MNKQSKTNDYDGNYEELIKNEIHNLYKLEKKVPNHLKPTIHLTRSTLENILYSNAIANYIARI